MLLSSSDDLIPSFQGKVKSHLFATKTVASLIAYHHFAGSGMDVTSGQASKYLVKKSILYNCEHNAWPHIKS